MTIPTKRTNIYRQISLKIAVALLAFSIMIAGSAITIHTLSSQQTSHIIVANGDSGDDGMGTGILVGGGGSGGHHGG